MRLFLRVDGGKFLKFCFCLVLRNLRVALFSHVAFVYIVRCLRLLVAEADRAISFKLLSEDWFAGAALAIKPNPNQWRRRLMGATDNSGACKQKAQNTKHIDTNP